MKKFFIVLLVAAIGVTVYFYFRQKQKNISGDIKHQFLGKWELDSVRASMSTDSLTTIPKKFGFIQHLISGKTQVEFTKDSLLLQSLSKQKTDTTHYQFSDGKYFLIGSDSDTVPVKWNLERIDKTLMTLESDRTHYYFHRIE